MSDYITPIRVIYKDGTVQEITPESFSRLEIDLDYQQTVWVEGPARSWYGGPGVPVMVMGRPGAIAHFVGTASNALLATALPDMRHLVKYNGTFADDLAELGVTVIEEEKSHVEP